jgi:hypothetical protein
VRRRKKNVGCCPPHLTFVEEAASALDSSSNQNIFASHFGQLPSREREKSFLLFFLGPGADAGKDRKEEKRGVPPPTPASAPADPRRVSFFFFFVSFIFTPCNEEEEGGGGSGDGKGAAARETAAATATAATTSAPLLVPCRATVFC